MTPECNGTCALFVALTPGEWSTASTSSAVVVSN
jgi:hypothetical protein